VKRRAPIARKRAPIGQAMAARMGLSAIVLRSLMLGLLRVSFRTWPQ
jgi:hypothetical protein